MTTFAQLLKESSQLIQMSAEFSSKYLDIVDAKQGTPCIAVPATETTQGEQKAPVAKPNGVTR